MFLFKDIFLALILMGFVNASVLRSVDATVPNTRTSLERRATATCTAENWILWGAYSVTIYIPFIGGADCDATYYALEDALNISNWQCVNIDGHIQLWFNCAPGDGASISSILESRYPSVDGFNCPDSGL